MPLKFNSYGASYSCIECGGPTPNYGRCAACESGTPRTQKGKGIVALRNQYAEGTVIRAKFVTEPDQLPDAGWPWFCRPAPSQPRHGYIDSRPLKTKEQAAKLLKEVLKDDPNGELILCPLVKAKWNAVLTPTSLVVGAGNDGATAGKDTAVVPLVDLSPLVPASVRKQAGIKEGDWPFLEVVQQANQTPILTQLRGGPALGTVKGNFIPETTEVKHVLHADPEVFKDLGWEKAIEDAKPGTVVWHPGGAMSDHFSIHAFAANIPIVFDKVKPKVGDTLEKCSTKEEWDPQAMLRGFIAGEVLPLRGVDEGCMSYGGSSLISAMLMGLHNATAMTGESSKWIGLASAIMIRLGCLALRGESRHHKVNGVPPKLLAKGAKPPREHVYAAYKDRPMSYHRASLNRVINVFRYGNWPSAGFGGMKWACCGASVAGLLNAVQRLAADPTAENAAKMVAELNLAVNQAHNGGWWLNKFASVDYFTNIPKGDIVSLIRSMDTFGLAHKIIQTQAKKKGFVQKQIAKYAAWPVTKLAPPYTKSASVNYTPAAGTVKMTVTTRLLRSSMRSLTAEVKGLAPDIVEAMKNNTFLVEGDDGYQLHVQPEKGEPLVIWTEESLAQAATKNAPKNH